MFKKSKQHVKKLPDKTAEDYKGNVLDKFPDKFFTLIGLVLKLLHFLGLVALGALTTYILLNR